MYECADNCAVLEASRSYAQNGAGAQVPFEQMTSAQVLRVIGFTVGSMGLERDGIVFTGAPVIPGLDGRDVQRWIVFWSWLEQPPQTTFAQFCAARGVCRCTHGDCAHGDGDGKGRCDVCDCTRYAHLESPPARAIAYLTSRSIGFTEQVHAQENLRGVDRRAEHAEQAGEDRTQRVTEDRLRQAEDREIRALDAERRAAAAIESLRKERERKAANVRREQERLDAARTGNRIKTIDVGD